MDSTTLEPYYLMGTGSRSMRTDPNAQSIYRILVRHILYIFEQKPELVLISGLAEGWDEAIAKAAIQNDIPFIAAIPNTGYGDYYWRRTSLLKKDRLSEFQDIVSKAIEIVFVCDKLYDTNGLHSNFVRNQWMVDKCHGALVYQGNSRGTRDAIERLQIAHKPYQEYPFTSQLRLF